MSDIPITFPLAFLAGLVSFLSPCVLPVVPAYVTFVSGLTLEELRTGDAERARRRAILHSVMFGVGFGLVFMSLGAAASAAGRSFAQALPWLSRAGGVVVLLFGLYLLGWVRLPALARDVRVHLTHRPAGPLGSLLVGIAFGAGWSPCIGPVLATILFYAGLDATVIEGTLLLGAYGAGLGLPFVLVAAAPNWLLARSARLRSAAVPLERAAGAVLLVVGLLMVSGRFAALSAFLAGMGQLVDLEVR